MNDHSLSARSLRAALCCERGYKRKKQPEQVRAALIHSAAELAAMQGLAGVTVQAVAAAAGVTKGGFFHHFPHKQALLDAVFDHFMAENEQAIDRMMAADDLASGCFTRAYISVAFDDILQAEKSLSMPLSRSMMGSPELCERWAAWLAGRLQRHRDTDCEPQHEVARLAADGAWLACSLGNSRGIRDPLTLKNYLLTLTREHNSP
ncbi:TetR/AcrR family transcriptional regulator [Erwinia persicina]|uniref:TetR/AcrR family transcriptional regulator n=1 Tax=Erwinia persicina TaxID=55211 RepID=UPI0017845645|nr:TetR/AcrR family transcriptional regulator [Erwinia persicina]MBD8163929.1 TetR/AcrR family transcriptional regulator [Erwinia persicina]